MRAAIIFGLFAVPSAALAQVDAGMNGCGAVTPEGMCSGDVLTYCDVDTSSVVVVDCRMEFGGMATCIEIDPVYGVDCAVATGEECVAQDIDGNVFSLFCQGTNAGCLETADTATCTTNVGPCDEDDISTCIGQRLVLDCAVNQPWLVDCASFGATCDDAQGLCVGAPEGSFCDDSIECAAGLICDVDICAAPGTDAGVVDTGAGGQDAQAAPDTGPRPDSGVSLFDTGVARSDGGGNTEDTSGCSCNSNDLRPSALLLFFLALLALRLRRSR